LVLATLTLSPAFGAQATSNVAVWTPPGPTACSVSGWTTNVKPAIAVRAAPSANAQVLGRLPTTRGDDPDPDIDYYSVTFDVTEARDGWLKIKNASDDMTGNDTPRPRPVYRGEGWIEAEDVQVGIQSARGYARPDAGSERLLDLKSDWLTEEPPCAVSSRAMANGCCWITRCAKAKIGSRWLPRTARGRARGFVAFALLPRRLAICAPSTSSPRHAWRSAVLAEAAAGPLRCALHGQLVRRCNLGLGQLFAQFIVGA